MRTLPFDPASVYRWVVSSLALVVFKFVVNKALSVQTAFAKIRYVCTVTACTSFPEKANFHGRGCPGRVVLWLNPSGAVALVLGTTFPRPGMGGYYAGKFSLYKKFGATSFASVWITSAQQFFWLADSEAVKIVTSDRHTFQKDIVQYELLNIYGGNLANIALVWSESFRVVNEWFEQLDIDGPDMTVDMLPSMTQATLLVLATAGFGRQVSWTAEATAEPPPGCKLTFRSAVLTSVGNVIFRALVPKWFYQFSSLIKVPYLSSRALLTQLAFDDLRVHMLDLVASARAEIMSGERHGASGAALLRNLVEANMKQDGHSKRLTKGELLSNIFAFLLAGHETSSHTLCFAFALLALHSDCQQKLYEEVIRVWPADVPLTQLMTLVSFCLVVGSTHTDSWQKEYTAACIQEALRVFPAEPRIPKDVHQDTVLPGTSFIPGPKEDPFIETGKFSMAVPAGSVVVVDVWALHMNPLYWGEHAAEFKPERFIDTESYQWPRNACKRNGSMQPLKVSARLTFCALSVLPFSGGARSCIGQRFALAEMVCILASVVRRYQIRVPDDLANKPFEEQKEVLLRWTTGITLTPVNVRVKLCRRV
ncbi:cytochrome P450 [Butyriboletus roseoflavus]|nr:cytochrome P450 [Butyriboletus roseoflavus]